MKHGNEFYIQLSRCLFQPPHSQLSINARWLYVVLNELEHRFCTGKEDFFFRSNEDLAKDTGLSLPTLKRAKAELLETDLVESWQAHWQDPESGRRSSKHITVYRILK